jgi:fumarylpyruvate hydrolase
MFCLSIESRLSSLYDDERGSRRGRLQILPICGEIENTEESKDKLSPVTKVFLRGASSMKRLPEVTQPTTAITGSADRFPVRRIYCVGQNYAAHAREMGSDPDRKPPFFFTKPADAVVANGSRLAYPSLTQDFQHEVELVLALGGGGERVAVADAANLIYGWAVGIDLTRRDLQAEAKKMGRPWDMAKGFDQSAPLAALTVGVPPSVGTIQLHVNGQMKQSGDLAEMIWTVPEVIANLSTYVRLAPGDLIFTGTPSGVGAIRPGDSVRGSIEGTEPIEVVFESAN